MRLTLHVTPEEQQILNSEVMGEPREVARVFDIDEEAAAGLRVTQILVRNLAQLVGGEQVVAVVVEEERR